jgi:glycosyltransferase involved in cell wall biosynthesis
MPKVSVIVPTYNRCNLVLETLESVFQQTYKDFEVIVVNDGSPDSTGEILRPLEANGRIRYVEQPNQGLSCARNSGASVAAGEYLAFLDDDDLWPADKLEWQVSCLERNARVAMVYGVAKSFQNQFKADESTENFVAADNPTGDCHRAFLGRNYLMSIGQTLIRRTAFEKAGGFEPGRLFAEDWDLYIRLSKLGPFIYEKQLALHYRKHSSPGRVSHNLWKMYRGHCEVRAKHLGKFPRTKTVGLWFQNFIFWRHIFSRGFFGSARHHFATGNVLAGCKALTMSIWLWPPKLLQISFYRAVKSVFVGWLSFRAKRCQP